jgi:hypothetical protein
MMFQVFRGEISAAGAGDSGNSINLPNGVLQRDHIAPRRSRGTASRVLGKFPPVYPQEKITLLLQAFNGCRVDLIHKLHTSL